MITWVPQALNHITVCSIFPWLFLMSMYVAIARINAMWLQQLCCFSKLSSQVCVQEHNLILNLPMVTICKEGFSGDGHSCSGRIVMAFTFHVRNEPMARVPRIWNMLKCGRGNTRRRWKCLSSLNFRELKVRLNYLLRHFKLRKLYTLSCLLQFDNQNEQSPSLHFEFFKLKA